MYWLYQHKNFSIEKRYQLFNRKVYKYLNKYLLRYFCQDTQIIFSDTRLKNLFNFADSLSISYDELLNKAFFGFIYNIGCPIDEIADNLFSVQLKLYFQDINLKPVYSVKKWFTAEGYVNHKVQDSYYFWLLTGLYRAYQSEFKNKVDKLVDSGILPESYIKNLINRG